VETAATGHVFPQEYGAGRRPPGRARQGRESCPPAPPTGTGGLFNIPPRRRRLSRRSGTSDFITLEERGALARDVPSCAPRASKDLSIVNRGAAEGHLGRTFRYVRGRQSRLRSYLSTRNKGKTGHPPGDLFSGASGPRGAAEVSDAVETASFPGVHPLVSPKQTSNTRRGRRPNMSGFDRP